ncbi:Uroporphyrinogen decarboxylase, partial [Dissostichus eleginoides]
PPRAARRVELNAGGTAWRLPQDQTCRRAAAVPGSRTLAHRHMQAVKFNTDLQKSIQMVNHAEAGPNW